MPQVVILYITEYDALDNGQMITHVKRCMDTQEGYIPVDDGEITIRHQSERVDKYECNHWSKWYW